MEHDAKLTMIGASAGIIGALIGSLITGFFTLTTTNTQLEVQSFAIKSEASLNLLRFRAEAIEKLYLALSNLHASEIQDTSMQGAAKNLAIAASIGAARFRGEAGVLCFEIQVSANRFANSENPEEMTKHLDEVFSMTNELLIILHREQEELSNSVTNNAPS